MQDPDIPPAVVGGEASGDAVVPLHRVYQLDEIRQAHAEMEAGRATGKIVVMIGPA